MRIIVNSNPVNIVEKEHFLAEGGEGKIFIKDNVAYKIYHEKPKSDLIMKIKDLMVLNRNNILNPRHEIYDTSNNVIGFSMPFVRDTECLVKLITNSYRDRNGITPNIANELVNNMAETLQYIHENKFLFIDGNEYNYLVSKKDFTKPYVIDVDSFGSAKFPATAIMPSVNDYHAKEFSELTDWFTFGIVALQVLIGIHPYKGKYTDKLSLEERMKKNISIFNPNVKVNAAVRDFDLIPSNFRDWAIDVYEKGKRLIPPNIKGVLIKSYQEKIIPKSSGAIDITKLKEFDSPIYDVNNVFGINIVKTKEGFFINKKSIGNYENIILKPGAGFAYIKTEDKTIKIYDGDTCERIGEEIPFRRDHIKNNNLYVFGNGRFTEYILAKIGNKLTTRVGVSTPVYESSSTLFKNVLMSNCLGKHYFYIPFGDKKILSDKIDELDGFTVMDAKYENGILFIVASKKGKINYFIFRFDSKGNLTKETSIKENVNFCEVNMTVLQKGIAAILYDTDLILTPTSIDKLKIFKDVCSDNNRLFHLGEDVMMFNGKEVFGIKTRS